MNEELFSNIKFDEVLFPRYVKVKESIENLMKIIDFEQVKKDGIDRVLQAFLQLIQENDDKTVEEKRAVIEDAIYNGNVFKHYFNEEDKERAVEVLSNTALLNDEEKLIYVVNFYMPRDVDFTDVYSDNDKNIKKIAEHYELNGEDADTFVYARVAEISKFYEMYRAEKERQRRFNETQVLAAMQDATDVPSEENINKAKTLIDELTNNNLKETLQQQLKELEDNDNYIEPGIEELSFDAKIVEEPVVFEEPKEESTEDSELEEVLEFASEELNTTETENLQSEDTNLEVEEPTLLEEVITKDDSSEELPKQKNFDKKVGEEVMASLQSLVAGARENARKVEQLTLDLEMKDYQINDLQATVTSKEEEIVSKNQQIESQAQTLQAQNKRIDEQDARLSLLESELVEKNTMLENANRLIATKDEQITSLNTSLNAYKSSLDDIQRFLSRAQNGVEIQETSRKVA